MKKSYTIILLLLLIGFNIVAQTLPYNQEFQVNTYTYADQRNPESIVLSSQAIVFCWDSWEYLGFDRGIYAQMYDENGNIYGSEIHVNTYQDSYQVNPKITALPSGGFVICWESYGQDGSGYGLFAQIFDEYGIKIGEEFQINTYINNRQGDAVIKVFSNGDFIISWQSDGQDGSGYGVFAQIFSEDGVKKGLEFQVNTFSSGFQGHHNLLLLSTDAFIISWDCAGQHGIYAQFYNAQAIRQGQEFRISSSLYTDTFGPLAYLLNSNNILFCWRGDSFPTKIFAKIIDSDGNTVREEQKANSSFGGLGPQNPSVIILKSGDFIICWEESGIKAHLFDENGDKYGNEIIVNDNSSNGLIYSPALLSLPDSGFIISWYQQKQTNYDIYARIFDKKGLKKNNEFRVNTNTDGDQTNIRMVNIGDSGFLSYWNSPDDSDIGIFGKYFLNEPIEHQLTEFNLLSPQNNETVYLTNPQFVWEKASDIRICYPWEIEYELYIYTNEIFHDPIIKTGIEDTTTNAVMPTPGTNYYWQVIARNISGDSLWSSNVNQFYVDPNAVLEIGEDNHKLSIGFRLYQNYPNPFNPSTKISWQSPVGSWQTLRVYDILGNEVATLVNEYRPAGSYQIEFNPASSIRHPASGVYFYRLQTGDFVETKKMIFLK